MILTMSDNNFKKQYNNDSQKLELFKEFRKTRDLDLREQLIKEKLQIVIPIARKFHYTKESQEDLVQVGYIGLIKAVDNFKPEKGVKFITYATHCIMGEIRHYIRDKSESMKRPRWLIRLNREVAQFVETFLQENERLPTVLEISTALNIEQEGIIEILKSKYMVSLNDFTEDNPDTLMLNKIRSKRMESFKLPIEDNICLDQAIEKLKIMEKEIVYLFFYKDLTQTQIALDLGLSQKKVSRMLKKSILKLRDIIIPKKSNVD
ncbi:MAG: sigma-70 family RNA polymerase sigma factor [Candidatus Eremiobacteraeota bacterium]|nr:sigma-70 family RNA polymerase sigma factor [Candidatus Eremiobacteraeota bacterium]